MENQFLGYDELAAAQAQPEVTVNAAIDTVAAALCGEVEIPVASDANVAIGSARWRHATIAVTDDDVLLTAARDVIYPDVDTLFGGPSRMVFLFRNATAFDLTVKRTGGTGVVVPAGEQRQLRHNGTDIELAPGGAGGASDATILVLQVTAISGAVTSGTSKAYVRAPRAFTIGDIKASLFTESSSGDVEIDVKKNGVTLIAGSPLVNIPNGEKSSLAGDEWNFDDAQLDIADDDELTVDVVSPGTGAQGLTVVLIGYPPPP